MVAWTYVLIDGVNSVFESLGGAAGDAIKKSGLKDAARKAGINLPDPKMPDSGKLPSNLSESGIDFANNQRSQENINKESHQAQPQFKNFERVKDPRVLKATSSMESEYRMNQYIKQGWIDECFRQRDERLAEDDAYNKMKGR